MTEEEARAWLAGRNVPRETLARIEGFLDLLAEENDRQNLVAASTLATAWSRHVVDSAQLIDLAPGDGAWLDLGSGPGFPGLIIAALTRRPLTLIESRRRRVEFLHAAADALGVANTTTIVGERAETATLGTFAVISARAFAPLPRLFGIGQPFATASTRWVLPKGRGAAAELADARQSWQGRFALLPSVTDPDSAIIVADGVEPRTRA
jgi:16S rRNA (guanine527-N7)-methyltransferase